jgi:hypothetical protein
MLLLGIEVHYYVKEKTKENGNEKVSWTIAQCISRWLCGDF